MTRPSKRRLIALSPSPSSSSSLSDTPDITTVASPPTMCEHNEPYQSAEADLTLKSADGYCFKVEREVLSYSRGMLALGPGGNRSTPIPPIELSDPLENAAVLRIVLDLMCRKPLPEPLAGWLPLLVSVVQVLKKYDCERTMAHYCLILRTWAANLQVPDKLEIFSAAAHLDDIETCVLALARGGGHNDHRYNVPSTSDLNAPVPGNSVFDISARSVEQLERMPEMYKLALMRLQRGNWQASVHWQTFSQTFKTLISYNLDKMKTA